MENDELVRRSRSLVLYWHGGELTIENYLESTAAAETDAAQAFGVDPLTLELLGRFDDWADPRDVAASFPEHDPASVLDAIELLVESGLLCRGSDADRDGRLEREWRHWSDEARFFHFGTRNAIYTTDDHGHWLEAARLSGEPAPPIFKRDREAPRVYLPRAHRRIDRPFADVLASRRTHRAFGSQAVDLTVRSTVLHYTFGPMHFVDAREWGTLQFKTSPSGGARHELECYVAALSVAGLEPGLYHYCAEDHSLEVVSQAFTAERLERLCFDPHPASAAFVCFVTAVFGRAMHKYRHPRAYRVVLLDAGHVGQTFALACTALGLGPFQTAAFRDSEVDEALGIDGFAEGALYVLGAGRPAAVEDALPGPSRPAGA
jgi:SagB-type dehydrogenase family enzyme